MTWIKQMLDNKVSDYIRRWLEMPISGTLDVISLSKQNVGWFRKCLQSICSIPKHNTILSKKFTEQ